MRFPGKESVTVIHRVRQQNPDGSWARDSRGNAVYVDEQTVITGCSVQPSTSTEIDDDGRTQVSTQLVIYAPSEWPGGAIDAVLANGAKWEILGDPEPWDHPRLGHVVVRCQKAGG